MTSLEYIEVPTGEVLDVITLDAGQPRYATGSAEQMFSTWLARFEDAEIAFELLAGWSNGYVALRLAEQTSSRATRGADPAMES